MLGRHSDTAVSPHPERRPPRCRRLPVLLTSFFLDTYDLWALRTLSHQSSTGREGRGISGIATGGHPLSGSMYCYVQTPHRKRNQLVLWRLSSHSFLG